MVIHIFSWFCNNLHLEKDVELRLNKLESPLLRLKLTQWFWKRRWKWERFSEKSRTYKRQSEMPIWAFSLGKLKAYLVCNWKIRFSSTPRKPAFPCFVLSAWIPDLYRMTSSVLLPLLSLHDGYGQSLLTYSWFYMHHRNRSFALDSSAGESDLEKSTPKYACR